MSGANSVLKEVGGVGREGLDSSAVFIGRHHELGKGVMYNRGQTYCTPPFLSFTLCKYTAHLQGHIFVAELNFTVWMMPLAAAS